MIHINYMETVQSDISAKMRTILIDWIEEVHLKFKLVSNIILLFSISLNTHSTWPSTLSIGSSKAAPLRGIDSSCSESPASSSAPSTRKSIHPISRTSSTSAIEHTSKKTCYEWKATSCEHLISTWTSWARCASSKWRPSTRGLNPPRSFKLITSCSAATSWRWASIITTSSTTAHNRWRTRPATSPTACSE